MHRRDVEFHNDQGELLRGDLYLPLEAPRAWVIFAHCFTCAANWKAPVRIARALCRRNYAVLAFDFTGLGRSEGEFAETNFTTNVGDLVAAARWLETAQGSAPALLVGHSLGGAAALAAAADIDSVRAVATIAAPSRASHVANLLEEGAREEIERTGEGRVRIGGRPFTIRKQLLEDIERHDVPSNLGALRRALLVMHSPADDVVSIDEAAEIFVHALHPKSFVSLDGADHLLSRERDAEYAASVLAAWASRYVGGETEAAEAAGAGGAAAAGGAGEGAAIAATGATGFATEIVAAGHELVADEPVSLGGSDLGPTPYGLLSAALASCTSMTLQMYARRKGLALGTARVSVRHSRIHASDCAGCETREGKVDRFERELTLTGDLDEAARQRLAEIADRCPVHRTLQREVLIETVLADGER
ncbi:MAG: alpha/beta fold hydrolase [Gammaproteobacteria bacterium]|nr:alpha/beta fold hydrolase [Gammaproteobacteria bacterium]